MNNVLERLPGAVGTPAAGVEPVFANGMQTYSGSPLGNIAGDSIKQFVAPVMPRKGEPVSGIGNGFTSALTGGVWGIVQQLLAIIQQLVSMLGLGNTANSQAYFQNANASSTGDPHLAFNGTDASGIAHQAHFDSMTDHTDLLDSDSFNGGYQISTKTTQPGANGVTYNQQATVSTNCGGMQITLDKNGAACVTQSGHEYALANGQSYDFGNGETVTRNNDGSVIVADTNAAGGSITTTLTENGSGVDVNTQAQNVDLSGDLLHH